jgi:hypothetical protein
MGVIIVGVVVVGLPCVVTACLLRLLRVRPEATLAEAADALARALGWLRTPATNRGLRNAQGSRILDEAVSSEG